MARILFILNALLTLPFGVIGLLAPELLFAQFGLELGSAGVLVARGYATTLIAYGLVLLMMRNATNVEHLRIFLYSMAVFNLIETVIQSFAGVQGIANPMIWGTVTVHGGVFFACAVVIVKTHRGKNTDADS